MDEEQLAVYIAHITCILSECDDYIKECDLTKSICLWKYDAKDPIMQPSNVAFLYKDLMSKKQIKAYGEGFMSEPLPESKKAA